MRRSPARRRRRRRPARRDRRPALPDWAAPRANRPRAAAAAGPARAGRLLRRAAEGGPLGGPRARPAIAASARARSPRRPLTRRADAHLAPSGAGLCRGRFLRPRPAGWRGTRSCRRPPIAPRPRPPSQRRGRPRSKSTAFSTVGPGPGRFLVVNVTTWTSGSSSSSSASAVKPARPGPWAPGSCSSSSAAGPTTCRGAAGRAGMGRTWLGTTPRCRMTS